MSTEPTDRKAELLALLAECHTGDEERDHAKADYALLWFIDDPEITAAFDAVEKWYA